MQNTPQTFRGTGAPGVNFSDSYENHIGAHCQPSGYQPYSNSPYHPVPPQRPPPHQYANHQVQPGMPYRHHGGAYAPNQNQYARNVNQDMYRNHHSGYVGGPPPPQNIASKPWPDTNASSELMPPYGQVSHQQMMNNSPQMQVNSMRSPPHATSNMNPAPPQGQQHYRQMQSPAHSPHSWSQAQIPSPGVMHSSRTTPSPLPAHVRSPGHHSQQPFSPPAAHTMNMPHSQQQPENGQISPPMNPAAGDGHNPSNPLHSLQKMVMLEQDPSKTMMPLMGDGNEQFPNQCAPHNFVPEDGSASNESKDSAYSTYYNMDENRFESKPNNTANPSSYPNVQQVSNCNFPMTSHPLGGEESKQVPLGTSSTNMPEVPDHSPSVPSNCNSSVSCTSGVAQNNCNINLAECHHAESAPVFTDQTEAAISTNSEQALESKPNEDWTAGILNRNSERSFADVPNYEPPAESVANDSGEKPCQETSNLPVSAQIKQEDDGQFKNVCKLEPPLKSDSCDGSQGVDEQQKIDLSSKSASSNEKSDVLEDTEKTPMSTTIKLIAEVHNSDIDSDLVIGSNSQLLGDSLVSGEDLKAIPHRKKYEPGYEGFPPEGEIVKDEPHLENTKIKEEKIDSISPLNCNDSLASGELSYSKIQDISRNPVKVVIHRIRKNDNDDTWHVPPNKCESLNTENNTEKKSESKIPNVGPQIVILSPASSQKKFGFRSSVASNNVITVSEDNTIETIEKDSTDPCDTPKKGSNTSMKSSYGGQSADKRRGRPMGSKNRQKPGLARKRRSRKGNKKKKIEVGKTKSPETPSKVKRAKLFNGPYVHIVGNRESPTSIKVINVAQKEEEKLNKLQSKRNFSTAATRIKKPVGHLSTLSPTYDAFNRDKTWLCIFCHKGSHISGLGDLYGPYYIKGKYPESAKPSTPLSAGRGKRRKSEVDEKPAKRTRQAHFLAAAESTPVTSSSVHNTPLDSEAGDVCEIWIHEDCAIWCQGISLIGEEVQGLEDAVSEAQENICTKCSQNGATLGCWSKSCKEQYHFSCAKEMDCQMDIEKFSLLCPKHQPESHVSPTIRETGRRIKSEKKSTDRRNRCQ